MRRVTATVLALLGLFATAARLAAAEPNTALFTNRKKLASTTNCRANTSAITIPTRVKGRSPFKSSHWVIGSFVMKNSFDLSICSRALAFCVLSR
jgi:hypothetical protein